MKPVMSRSNAASQNHTPRRCEKPSGSQLKPTGKKPQATAKSRKISGMRVSADAGTAVRERTTPSTDITNKSAVAVSVNQRVYGKKNQEEVKSPYEFSGYETF